MIKTKTSRWNQAELKRLKLFLLAQPIGKIQWDVIAAILGRSVHSVKNTYQRHGFAEDYNNRDVSRVRCCGCKKIFPIKEMGTKKDKRKASGIRPESRCVGCRKKYYKENEERYIRHRKKRRRDRLLREHDLIKSGKYIELHREKMLWLGARKRADKIGVPFNIIESDVVIPRNCPLLGIPIKWNGMMNNRDSSPSLDRINPTLGYVRGNIAVISYRANRIKNNASLAEIELIAKNLRKLLLRRCRSCRRNDMSNTPDSCFTPTHEKAMADAQAVLDKIFDNYVIIALASNLDEGLESVRYSYGGGYVAALGLAEKMRQVGIAKEVARSIEQEGGHE
jgi:hypothetical protein